MPEKMQRIRAERPGIELASEKGRITNAVSCKVLGFKGLGRRLRKELPKPANVRFNFYENKHRYDVFRPDSTRFTHPLPNTHKP